MWGRPKNRPLKNLGDTKREKWHFEDSVIIATARSLRRTTLPSSGRTKILRPENKSV